jgi:TonB-dependent starch-binding outer membrane protein SusC
MRVKALTLSYTMPQNLIAKAKLTGVKFYFTGENLFTITDYKGYDPEVSAFGADGDNVTRNVAAGIDFGTYPQTRNLIFGVNVSF